MSMTSQFPLYCAAGHGHVDTVDYLLRQGADVQLQLAEGKTVAQWLRQYAVDNIRYQKCLELVTR
jgi:ankyrin repeat protein